ncbi:leucine-rich repeat-containing protein 23-like isoform X2 [Biomphalaria glabrata]|uniref:Leucine-rich repeat-containing protein 23-like isoform X2 n=1 Tax=Biomphalaria glabrata TaxID=6526 RepID=A0A2C9JYE8_BIOGL|nr:leucine-rich repeat-containing protein 23-like isoform X2 [Biomphalaria glabrata]KAI8731715.1 leucine-rich repeat-containing protein 23-like isoform X2 [Biomphalaria glabrata]
MSDDETEQIIGNEEEDGIEIDRDKDEGAEDIQGDEEDHVEEEKIQPNPLSQELIADSLSLLCKTGDGLSHAYAQLDIHERELTNIDILKSFIHLRYVDISKNMLKDISALNYLTQLLTLKAEENLLTSAKLDEMPYLQVANFSHNKITTTEGINHPMLEHINLNHNNIQEVTGLEAGKLSRLHTLELRNNKLKSLEGINLPNLKNLFVASNLLKKIEGMSRLPGLNTIHLRENQIESLEGFSELQMNLQYINLRGNAIPNVREVTKLKVLPMLRAVVLSENPCAEEDDYRLETLIAIRTLERLDKDEYSPEERSEAEEIAEKRRAEEEEKAGEETEHFESTLGENPAAPEF